MINRTAICVALALGLCAGGALAKGKPDKAGKHKGPETVSSTDVVVDIVFTEVERRIISEFYGPAPAPSGGGGGGGKGLPPGLAKRGELPPGLAKRQQLPPGLAKKALPGDLTSRLGPPRGGTERVIVDNNVLLVQAATGVVLDILYDVVTR